jgi:hypothetical protein
MPSHEAQLTAVLAAIKSSLTPEQVDLVLALVNLLLTLDRTAVKE